MSSERTTEANGAGRLGVLGKILLHVVLPLIVLGGGYLIARHLVATAPTTPKTHRPRSARAVEVVEVKRTTTAPTIEAMGLVKPAREVTLRPRVSGEVVSIAPQFAPGGRFSAGADLLKIDQADFDLAVSQAQAGLDQTKAAHAQALTALAQAAATRAQRSAVLAEAQANLKLEEGNQAVARRELEMLEGSRERANRELVLRTPQLAIALAAVESAQAGVKAAAAGVKAAEAGVDAAKANIRVAQVRLDQAELDRTRTTLKAPFNAWIRETYVEVGAMIAVNTNVTTLVGSDAYWVEVTLPLSDLESVPFPKGEDTDAPDDVVIRDRAAWGPEGLRKGRLLRLLGDLEPAGRMARVLVEVKDPLHLQAEPTDRYPLLTGSYVRVEIPGRDIANVAVMDRTWLRHGDVVWVADPEDKLRIRKVEIRWRGRDEVFLGAGLEPGDRVITTDLSAPVDGMPVKVRGEQPRRSRP